MAFLLTYNHEIILGQFEGHYAKSYRAVTPIDITGQKYPFFTKKQARLYLQELVNEGYLETDVDLKLRPTDKGKRAIEQARYETERADARQYSAWPMNHKNIKTGEQE